MTRSQYQRRLTAASRHALDALVDAHSGPVCPHVRRLITERPVGLLDRDEAGRRDAHLEECVHCRAFCAAGARRARAAAAAGRRDARAAERSAWAICWVAAARPWSGCATGTRRSRVARSGWPGAGTALTAGLGREGRDRLRRRGDGGAVRGTAGRAAHPRARAREARGGGQARSGAKRSAPQATVAAASDQHAGGRVRGPRPSAARRATRVARPTRPQRLASTQTASAQEFGPESSVPATARHASASAASAGGEFSPPPPPPPPAEPARSAAVVVVRR